MWVARDKDGNYLNMFFNKPIRHLTNNGGEWIDPVSQKCSELYYYTEDGEYIEVPNFEHLKWEDEPVEIKLVPHSANVIEMPSEEELERIMPNVFAYGDGLTCGERIGWRNCFDWIKLKIVK